MAGSSGSRSAALGPERARPRSGRCSRGDGRTAGQEFGAYVIGTGRAADRQAALDFGANEFVDLDGESLDDVGAVDLVFDVIGGDVQARSARLVRPGGSIVSIVGPVEATPTHVAAIDFVVESDRAQLTEVVNRIRDGRLRTLISAVVPLAGATTEITSTERRPGKTVIQVR